jgi:hypothetical protein
MKRQATARPARGVAWLASASVTCYGTATGDPRRWERRPVPL